MSTRVRCLSALVSGAPDDPWSNRPPTPLGAKLARFPSQNAHAALAHARPRCASSLNSPVHRARTDPARRPRSQPDTRAPARQHSRDTRTRSAPADTFRQERSAPVTDRLTPETEFNTTVLFSFTPTHFWGTLGPWPAHRRSLVDPAKVFAKLGLFPARGARRGRFPPRNAPVHLPSNARRPGPDPLV